MRQWGNDIASLPHCQMPHWTDHKRFPNQTNA